MCTKKLSGMDRWTISPCCGWAQADGWTWLTFANFPMPDCYLPRSVRLRIKLPPGFPDAEPDMFWLSPPIRTTAGNPPQGSSVEPTPSGESWQQFSWHLHPGAWIPGISSLRDYMRCVRARLEKRN